MEAERPRGRVAGRDTKKVPASEDVGYGNLRSNAPGAAGRGALFYGASFVTRYGVRPGKRIRSFRSRPNDQERCDGRGTMEALLTFIAKRQRGALAELAKGASRTSTPVALPAIASPA